MKEFLQRAVAFTMFAVYFLSVAPASQIAQDYATGQRTLDSYLEHAQIQSDRERFEKIAEQGIGAAVAEWEQSTLELKARGYDEWLLQKEEFKESLEERKNLVFAKWLLKKQNEQKAELQKSAFYEELQSAALAFAYTTANNEQTRIVSKEFIGQAKDQWSKKAQEIVQKYLDAWNQNNLGIDERELLGLKLRDEEKNTLLQNAQKEAVSFLQGEFLALENSVTNALVNDLLYDHTSLKKMSDEEAAAVIVQQIADGVDAETMDSMARLFNSMQTELENVDVNEDIGDAQEAWLERFERELERGLEKWNEAERGFLAARVEWEQSAENVFINDNKIWMEAYNELESRKQQWAQKIENQIEEGKAKWQKKLKAFSDEVDKYFEEFQFKLALEFQQKKEIVDEHIEAYNQCRDIIVVSQNVITLWYARWAEKYNGVYSYWKTEDALDSETNLNVITSQELKNKFNEWKKLYVRLLKDIAQEEFITRNYTLDQAIGYSIYIRRFSEKSSIKEINELSQYAYKCKNSLKEKNFKYYSKIDSKVWDTILNFESVWNAQEELFKWLDFYDKYIEQANQSFAKIYSITGGGIENSKYDEIESEAAKLSALESYWKNQQEIWNAVYEYSQDFSSSLESAQSTKQNLEAAKENYQQAKEEYQKQAESLAQKTTLTEQAKEEYIAAAQMLEQAYSQVEEQRKIYDGFYEEWNVFQNQNFFEQLMDLNDSLNAMELNDIEYEQLLLAYCDFVQAKENEEIASKIQNIRDIFENGKEEASLASQTNSEKLDSFGIDDLSEKVREEDFFTVGSKIFSNAELKLIDAELEEILALQEFSTAPIEQIVQKLALFDAENTEILKADLICYRNAEEKTDFLIEKIIEDLKKIQAQCQTELKQRDGILVLIDGNLKEIEEFFLENEGFEEVYKNYKGYSSALREIEQKEACAQVLGIIKGYSRENLEEYFEALDNAAARLNQAGKEIIALYKKSILNEIAAGENPIEKNLMESINNLFEDKNLIIRDKNFHIAIFESFFENNNGLSYPVQDEYSESQYDFSLLDTVDARAEILSKMQIEFTNAALPQAQINALYKRMEDQQIVIDEAKQNYEDKIELLRGDSENSALNLYSKACDEYNIELEKTQAFYDKAEEARRQLRIAEELYFYAENEYLHGNIDIKSELDFAREKLLRVQTAQQVLAQIKEERNASTTNFDNCPELNGFKESVEQYYKSRVMAYEYEQEFIAQKERVYQAQLAEKTAVNRLVCEYSDSITGTEFQIPYIASDFIIAKKSVNSDGSCSYSFSLNPSGSQSSAESDQVLMEYYTTYCIESQDIYGNKSSMTQAKSDALDFLYSLEDKNYNLEDLALALLYLKLKGSEEQKSRWLQDDEDPYCESNYPFGDIPKKMHSVNIWDAYEYGRPKVVEEAYAKVMENGGEKDLVNYILYSQTNISPDLSLYVRQHNALSIRAFEYPVKAINTRTLELRTLAAVQFGIMCMYSAILALPFGLGAWAAGLLAAATAIYVALTGAADKLDEIKADIREIQNGYASISDDFQNSQATYIKTWQEAIKERKVQEERFSVLVTGKKKDDGKKITWDDFDKAMKEIFDTGKTSSTYSYYKDMHNLDTNSKNLKDLFYETTQDDFTTVNQVITKMCSTLKNSYEDKTVALANFIESKNSEKNSGAKEFYSTIQNGATQDYAQNLMNAAKTAWGKDCFDKTKLEINLISFYGNSLLPTLPVRFGQSNETCLLCINGQNCSCNNTENYIEELLADMRQVYLNHMQEKSLAELDTKDYCFGILQEDYEDYYSSWLKKINSAAKTGIEEWQLADEKLNAAYNSWQKKWLYEYESNTEEWDKKYTQFLSDKQDWINNSYSQAGCPSIQISGYTPVAKMTSATKMENTVSEYISSLYDKNKFSRLAEFTDTLLSFANNDDSYRMNLLTLEKIDSSILKNYDEVCKMQSQIESDMKKAAAKYQAQVLEEQNKKNLEGYLSAINEKNKEIESWELDLVRRYGYRVDSEIHRNAVVDSTVFRTIREKQTVHRYEYFSPQTPYVSFDSSDYQGTNEYFIMRKIEEIQNKIQDWQERIFGKDGESQNEGELKKHIGKSPTFVDNIDLGKSRQENLKDPGSGQIGLILQDFQWNSMKNSQGYSELGKAIYDQKLFSSGGFHLPTIREILSTVCDILGNSGAVWIKYIDDVVFGAMDLGMGYKNLEEVANSFAQQTAMIGVSKAVNSAASSLFSGMKKGSQISAAAQKAAVGYTTSVASNYVKSFDFIRGSMDWEKANSSWISASALTSAAGTMVGGTLGEFNNVDANGMRLNQQMFGSNIETMNYRIGSLAAEALNYIATGDFSLNLASINDVGIFEIGIKDGSFSAGFGQGGAELSYKAIQDIIKGAQDEYKVSTMKNAGELSRATLNTANQISYLGKDEAVELARKLYSGENYLHFDENLGGGGLDSLIDFDGTRKIGISHSLLTGNKTEQALIDTLLARQFIEDKDTGKGGANQTLEQKTVDQLINLSSAYALFCNVLGVKASANHDAQFLQMLTEAYQTAGESGVYAIYAYMQKTNEDEIREKARSDTAQKAGEANSQEKTVSLAQVLDSGHRQTDEINLHKLLGNGKTKEEYNKLAKENAAKRYAQKEIAKKSNKLTEEELVQKALSDEKILKANGYSEQLCDSDLRNFGCTLSTVAYIVFSITNQNVTLQEANDIVKENNLFDDSANYKNGGNNGINEKNELGVESYAKAINAIAKTKDSSITQDIILFDSSKTGSANIFNKIIQASNSTEIFYSHLRTNGGHSVLFKSMTYTDKNKPGSASLSVLDPWGTSSKYTPKTIADLRRADFYKLTDAGKDIYNAVRSIDS